MTPKVLINLIVGQTTVLIAQLSTAAGIRAPLGDIAGQLFLELSRAIEAQGVPRKVVADMFGLALRGYQKKVQRLEESQTDSGTSLWKAVLDYVEAKGPLTRGAVEARFSRDDYLSVASVLHDLVQSGLLYRTGGGDSALYKAIEGGEVSLLARSENPDVLKTLVLSLLYREAGLSERLLAERLSLPASKVSKALAELVEEQRIRRADAEGYVAETLVIPVGDDVGWAAAVFDHYQAVATALVSKLRVQEMRSSQRDLVGGTTLTFDLDPDHPHREEVLGLLRRVREETDRLWEKVHDWNRRKPPSEEERTRVTFYFGQALSPLLEDSES